MTTGGHILALSGGVGGAKLALGLSTILAPRQLIIIANTGDDFEHLGMRISPDIDSLLYALAGVNNQSTGWGRDSETWTLMSELERLGIDSWFRLGDRDLAVHIYRTNCLRAGKTLSEVTQDLTGKFGVASSIIPMSDDRIGTLFQTADGPLPFQDYFVRYRCQPVVKEILFENAAASRPSPAFSKALEDPQLSGIVICPSNPYLSIDPILSVPGVVGAISGTPVPVVAVTPIVQGQSIKGPTAKIMAELGITVSALSVAEHYASFIDGFVLDILDKPLAEAVSALGITVEVTDTIMQNLDDRQRLARRTMALLGRLFETNRRVRGAGIAET
jgi:LPPG:FO 2-phospho-L-lactate transferase